MTEAPTKDQARTKAIQLLIRAEACAEDGDIPRAEVYRGLALDWLAVHSLVDE